MIEGNTHQQVLILLLINLMQQQLYLRAVSILTFILLRNIT